MDKISLPPYLEQDKASILLLLDEHQKVNPVLFQHWCLRLKDTGFHELHITNTIP